MFCVLGTGILTVRSSTLQKVRNTETAMFKLCVPYYKWYFDMNLQSLISISTSSPPISGSYATLKNLCSRYAIVKCNKIKVPRSQKIQFISITKKVVTKNLYLIWESWGTHTYILWGKIGVWMLVSFMRVEWQLCCYFITWRTIFCITWLTFMTLGTDFRPLEHTFCRQ
jgi:hypothetical protein